MGKSIVDSQRSIVDYLASLHPVIQWVIFIGLIALIIYVKVLFDKRQKGRVVNLLAENVRLRLKLLKLMVYKTSREVRYPNDIAMLIIILTCGFVAACAIFAVILNAFYLWK